MKILEADAVKEALRNRINENIDECINNVPPVDVFDKYKEIKMTKFEQSAVEVVKKDEIISLQKKIISKQAKIIENQKRIMENDENIIAIKNQIIENDNRIIKILKLQLAVEGDDGK